MTSLAHYDAFRRELDLAHGVDEVKDIRDKAMALQSYVRQAQDRDAERKLAEIRLRAERKAGQLLAGQKASGERRGRGGPSEADAMSDGQTLPPSLPDLGISRQQSSDWQRMAAMPEDEFERELAVPGRVPSTAQMVRACSPEPPCPTPVRVSDDALWLWGRLLEFEDRGLLGRPVEDVVGEMERFMADDVRRLAHVVASYLGDLPVHQS